MASRKAQREKKKAAKKQLKEAARAKVAEQQALIDAAYKVPPEQPLSLLLVSREEVEDQLEFVPLFRTYSKNGVNLKFYRASDLVEQHPELFEWAYALTERNMKAMYQQTWGWSKARKRKEMKDDKALYVIATDEEDSPVGFFHFRFLYEEDKKCAVSYLYEIQIEESYQGKGLGSLFMVVLQIITKKNKINHVLLTVFFVNEKAYDFYTKKLKYVIDETSPSRDPSNIQDPQPHEVLSKAL